MSRWDARYSHHLLALFKELWCVSQGHGCLTCPLFLSLFSLWHTLSASFRLSHSLLACRTVPQQMQVCRCLAPLPSLAFPPLSSSDLQLKSRADSLSHEAGLLSFLNCWVVWEWWSKRKRKGGRKEERKQCWANWPNWCATPGHQRSADSQPESYCRKTALL